MRKFSFGLVAIAALTHCGGDSTTNSKTAGTSAVRQALDDVNVPPAGVSLLVLGPNADYARITRTIEDALHGTVFQFLAPRFAIVSMPTGIDAILSDLGVSAHYERAVDPSELGRLSVNEQRFVRVFDNRFYPATTPSGLAIAPKKLVLPAGAPFEVAPKPAPAKPAAVSDDDYVTTPFASGTVVVSVLLPESNGASEPSTEDWTEDQIVETYQKVETALEAIVRSEPNSKLRFIVHYESAPANGGLPGTIDCDYEFGKHAQFGGEQNPPYEGDLVNAMLAKVMGTTPDYSAPYTYLNKLRTQYHADGAYFITVAANGNFTASLRAHAYIGGPSFVIDSAYGWSTYMHEQGHIFGALDEYCPDACSVPTALQGYLGSPNANATYFPFSNGPGYNYGAGENQNGLMKYNDVDAVNGWTRGAWGWLDADADGLIDVRDTTPRIALAPSVSGNDVHLVGTLEDVPMTAMSGSWGARSWNTVDTVQVHFGSDFGFGDDGWFDVPVKAPQKGLSNVDLDVGNFAAGHYQLQVRAKNSVGNVSAVSNVALDVASTVANTAPFLHFDVSPRSGSTNTFFVLRAKAKDTDVGDSVDYRFDTDGDGTYDTPWSPIPIAPALRLPAGIRTLRAQVRDKHGAVTTSSFDVVVRAKNAIPEVTISGRPSMVVGRLDPHSTFNVAKATDGDYEPLEYNWIFESATDNETVPRSETGFSAANTSFAMSSLGLPTWLRAPQFDFNVQPPPIETLAKGDGPPPFNGSITQVVALSPTLVAAGTDHRGLYVVDVSDVSKATGVGPAKAVAQLTLETDVRQMVLDGTRLYVLGAGLTVVDVTDPTKPVEIKQSVPITSTATADDTNGNAISDGGKPVDASLSPAVSGNVTDVSLDVEIDHPAWEELRVTLSSTAGGKGGSNEVVLWDHQPGSGHGTLHFDASTSKALAAFLAQPVASQYDVRVYDDVTTDPTHVGSYVSSHLSISAGSYAAPVVAGATSLLGVLQGKYVVVAGNGLQVLDATAADAITQYSFLASTPALDGALYGTTAIVVAQSVVKGLDATTDALRPTAKGLYAVDLSVPNKPKVVRNDATDDYTQLVVAGRKMFVNNAGSKASPAATSVGDIKAFLAGGTWKVGTMQPIAATAFGDDRSLWDISTGKLQRFDVTATAAPKLAAEYPDPTGAAMSNIGGDRAVVFDTGRDGGSNARLVALTQEMTPLSGVYRITLQARDGSGEIGSASRTLHVVPYDNAPSIDSVVVTSGAKVGDDYVFTLTASDPDQALQYDMNGMVRVDFDDDGAFDTDWQYVGWSWDGGHTVQVHTTFATPGRRVARFELRDWFGAKVQKTLTFDVN